MKCTEVTEIINVWDPSRIIATGSYIERWCGRHTTGRKAIDIFTPITIIYIDILRITLGLTDMEIGCVEVPELIGKNSSRQFISVGSVWRMRASPPIPRPFLIDVKGHKVFYVTLLSGVQVVSHSTDGWNTKAGWFSQYSKIFMKPEMDKHVSGDILRCSLK